MKGLEDTPEWNHSVEQDGCEAVGICHWCGKAIALWHCEETGCPWCAACGTRAAPPPKNKGVAGGD